MCGMRNNEAINKCRRLCSTMPLRASTKIMAKLVVEAPVTILRVYCICPGVSAIINFRFGVAK